RALISLGADEDTLVWYQALKKDYLKVSTAVSDQNAQGHWDLTLAWFWTIDVQRDAELDDWMSEFYRGQWLRVKALKDRWEEEVELLRAEGKRTINFFDYKARSNKRVGSHTNSSSFSTGNLSFNVFSLASLVPLSFNPKASAMHWMSMGKVPAPTSTDINAL
ncbi:hypothetical protein PAXRUDRAFT_144037, partial [Paxillus rubicundulus Ve08.2h10]